MILRVAIWISATIFMTGNALAADCGVPARVASANARATPGPDCIDVISSSTTSRLVMLELGKSVVIDLTADIKDVLIGNPKIVLATVRTNRRAYLTAGETGRSNVFFFGEDGRQIGALLVTVSTTPELDPPMLENSSNLAPSINIYRGPTERVVIHCAFGGCSPAPKEPPPPPPPANILILPSAPAAVR
jgi:Flp pilus assembly secretin CpaC